MSWNERVSGVAERPAGNEGREPIAARCLSAAVIISTYSDARLALLLRALEAMRTQTVQAREVLVVVDHNPALAATLRQCCGQARVLENTGAAGASGARNTGAAAAHGEVLVFLDDDAEPGPGWLEHLLEHYGDPAVIAVGGPSNAAWHPARPRWFPLEMNWVVGCTQPSTPHALHTVRNLWGVNLSVRAEAARAVRFFDERVSRTSSLPAGYEDTDLCMRLTHAFPGCRILHAPGAAVLHHVPPSRCTRRYMLTRCFCEGRSKARLAACEGREQLDVERRYITEDLLPGMARRLFRLCSARAATGDAQQCAAMISGSAAALSGYLCGAIGETGARWAGRRAARGRPADGAPSGRMREGIGVAG